MILNEQIVSDHQTIGIMLTLFGMIFFVLGIVFVFDKPLMGIGNLLFLLGLLLLLGFGKVARFMFQWHRLRGTAFFLSGMAVILVGYTFVGFLLEGYGFYSLFGGSGLSTLFVFILKRVPYISDLFNTYYNRDALPY